MYVLKGTTLTFQALPLAPDTNFPPANPVWGGTAGASGTGATKTVTFSTTSNSILDYKTVTVKCGNTVGFNVIVYDVTPLPVPNDNFAGRDLGTYGVGEDVNLSTIIFPLGLTTSDTYSWSASGANSVMNGSTLYVGDVNQTGNVTLTLTIRNSLSQGQTRTVTKSVTAPTGGVLIIEANDIPHFHIQGNISAGFTAHLHLHPVSVSFHRCLFQETNNKVEQFGATGVFTYLIGSWHNHDQNGNPTIPNQIAIGGGDATLGCRVDNSDRNIVAAGSIPRAGTLNLPIPWNYYVPIYGANNFTGPTVFVTVSLQAISDSSGNCTVSKAGASSTSAFNDPTTP